MHKGIALYQKIYWALKEDIASGLYADGKRLPTEKELSAQFFVSRITAQKALSLLEKEGLILRIPGKGTFLKEDSQVLAAFERPHHRRTCAFLMGGYSVSFGLELLNSVLNRAEELNIHMIYKLTNNDQQLEAQMLRNLVEDKVEGIIIQPAQGELYSEALQEAVNKGVPVVMIDRVLRDINAPCVVIDNRMLSRIATEKLLAAGHRNIALVTMTNDTVYTMRERMIGFEEAFANRRLKVPKRLWATDISGTMEQTGLTDEYPRIYDIHVEKLAQHLKAHPEITAIFSAEFLAAQASWEAVLRIGKRVPEDISIVCFDKGFGFMQSRSMGYIRQPQNQMGQLSVDLLLRMINGEQLECQEWLLDGEWVEGGSIVRPKRTRN